MNRYIITIDPQPTLMGICIKNKTVPSDRWRCVKVPFVEGSYKNKNKTLCQWMNHRPDRVISKFDYMFSHEILCIDNLDQELEEVHVEGQFQGKAMICLEAFIKGYFSTKYPLARVHSLPARSWKIILGCKAKKGKEYYEKEQYAELYETCQIDDYCEGNLLRRRNHDIVDAYCMMKYLNKQ